MREKLINFQYKKTKYIFRNVIKKVYERKTYKLIV